MKLSMFYSFGMGKGTEMRKLFVSRESSWESHKKGIFLAAFLLRAVDLADMQKKVKSRC
jgi:hypothetical protein